MPFTESRKPGQSPFSELQNPKGVPGQTPGEPCMLVNMNDLLLPAREGHYAVGYFNAVSVEMARAVIETAEELNAPVMIGTAEVLLPITPLVRVSEYLVPMARRASVPVCVHYDHGLTYEKCLEALRYGFTSIMYDCSTAGYEANVERVALMAQICHAMKATIEGELGHVGDNEGAGRLSKPSDYFTDPAAAFDYVKRTGIDSLAVAVGNAHGDYKFPPKLDFERIETIADRTGLPLVLHGGSGLADSDFRIAVQKGICKVNIFTDLDKAGVAGTAAGFAAGKRTRTGLIPYEIDAMKEVVREKLELFGSVGKARARV